MTDSQETGAATRRFLLRERSNDCYFALQNK